MAAPIMQLANRLAMERANVRGRSSEPRKSRENTVSHEARERTASHAANLTTNNGTETAAIWIGSRIVAGKRLLRGGAAIVLAILICGSFMLGRLSTRKPKRKTEAPIAAVDGRSGKATAQESSPGQVVEVPSHPTSDDSNCATSGVPDAVSAAVQTDLEPVAGKQDAANPAPAPTPSESTSLKSLANPTNNVIRHSLDVKGEAGRK